MAKIKLGGLAQDVRGSQNGLTFSRNKGGAYVRAKVSPPQPRSERQLAQRGILSVASQAWRTLEPEERGAWIAWANAHPILNVFGDSIILSGNSAFVRVNGNRLTLGLELSEVPPPEPTTPPAAATAAAANGTTGVVTVTLEAAGITGDLYEIWTSPGQSPGVSAGVHKVRLAGVFVQPATPVASITVNPFVFNEHLAFADDQKVTVLVVRFSEDGLVIDSTRFDVIATTPVIPP